MGRPKGSKNKPKSAVEGFARAYANEIQPGAGGVPKKRGRPVGSKNKPKTITELGAAAFRDRDTAPKGATVSFLPPEVPGEGYFVKCQVSRLGLELSVLHPDHIIRKGENFHTAMDVRNLVVNLCVEAVQLIREKAVKK